MRTFLKSREVNDNEKDYLAIEVEKFEKMSMVELNKAYSLLKKANRPLFSGSIDPIINQIDFLKLAKKLSGKIYQSEKEMELIETYIKIKKLMNTQKFTVGIWDYQTLSQSIPHTREGSTGVIIKD